MCTVFYFILMMTLVVALGDFVCDITVNRRQKSFISHKRNPTKLWSIALYWVNFIHASCMLMLTLRIRPLCKPPTAQLISSCYHRFVYLNYTTFSQPQRITGYDVRPADTIKPTGRRNELCAHSKSIITLPIWIIIVIINRIQKGSRFVFFVFP